MAGPQGEMKFLGTTMLVGFAAIAFALYKQRVVLNKYGYDVVLSGTDIDSDNILAPHHPTGAFFNVDGTLTADGQANPEAAKLGKALTEWREQGKKADHLHNDTGRDNRFLILKNEQHGPAVPPNMVGPVIHTDYYMYAQGRDGNYLLRKVDPTVLLKEMDYNGGPFHKGTFTQIKRDMTVIDRLLDPAQNGHQVIKAARSSVDPAKVEQWKRNNGKGLMLFGAVAAASKAPGLLQQAVGSGSYALMNAAGAKAKEGGGISGAAKHMLEPLRTKLDL